MKQLFLITAAVLVAGHANAATLVGTYSFSGTQSCVSVDSGTFNTLLEPTVPLAGVNAVVAGSSGFVKFKADGTGSVSYTDFSAPDFRYFPSPSAGIASIQTGTDNFTYTLTGDKIVITPVNGSNSGSYIAGSRTGQTFTVTGQAPSTGFINKSRQMLTLFTSAASVSTQVDSDGSTFESICWRNRILIEANTRPDLGLMPCGAIAGQRGGIGPCRQEES
jgi:hypothetical protein